MANQIPVPAVPGELWLGPQWAAQNSEWIEQQKIRFVLNVGAYHTVNLENHWNIQVMKLPVVDDGNVEKLEK